MKTVKIKKVLTKKVTVSTLKYNDLQKMCNNNAITKQDHEEYRNMVHPYFNATTLDETDEEDPQENY